jgi:hypothetical protein
MTEVDGKEWVMGENNQPELVDKPVEKAILPHHEEATLQDQDDVVIWKKFNLLIQAVDELVQEHGHAGDASRQLRVVTAEVLRRDMIGFSVREREPGIEQLRTWYEITKQFIDGANAGKWKHVDGDERQYVEVVKAMLAKGQVMPSQRVGLEPLDLLGELTSTSKKEA